MRIADQRIQELRKALKSANVLFSYKLIAEMATRAGFVLNIRPDALAKFGEGFTSRLTHESDFYNLETFFYKTEIGRLLVTRSSEKHSDVFNEFISGVRIRLPSMRAERANGRYFAYHGSIANANHFTIRLFRVKRQSNAIVSIKSDLRKSNDSPETYEAQGFLVFDKEDFQVLMFHENQELIGLNLIVFDTYSLTPRDGPLQSGAAQMMGLTARGRIFVRSLHFRRIESDLTDDELLRLTGDFARSELPDMHLKEFEHLASNLPTEYLRDPIFEFAQITDTQASARKQPRRRQK
jgi:hypothetical protein